MKKFLGFMAMAMAVVLLPMGAKAAGLTKDNFDTSCTKSCPNENGVCTSVCTVKVVKNSMTFQTMSGSLVFSDGTGITIKNFKAGDGWTKVSPSGETVSIVDKKVDFSFASTGVSASNFTLFTFTMELESADVNCALGLKIGEVEITVETETKDEVENPSTGASLPIALVGVGAVGAVVIYSVTKKNKKMYKI